MTGDTLHSRTARPPACPRCAAESSWISSSAGSKALETLRELYESIWSLLDALRLTAPYSHEKLKPCDGSRWQSAHQGLPWVCTRESQLTSTGASARQVPGRLAF